MVAIEPQPHCLEALRRIESERLVVVPMAAGAQAGTAVMRLASVDTISSLAETWIERVKASGRFDEHEWSDALQVETTTLDRLIQQYGIPEFCKIDVEGYEPEVLAGLSQPLPYLSFEFTPEFPEASDRAIAMLVALGFDRFNYALFESMVLGWSEWGGAQELVAVLADLPRDGYLFGDVYAATSGLRP